MIGNDFYECKERNSFELMESIMTTAQGKRYTSRLLRVAASVAIILKN